MQNLQTKRLNAPAGVWCSLTWHWMSRARPSQSQCTCRCVVLPDRGLSKVPGLPQTSLNAPAGAWCSLTNLSTRPRFSKPLAQCTCRCVVLPDSRPSRRRSSHNRRSQCTYRCVVLPDSISRPCETDSCSGLNAPAGAWCSLTHDVVVYDDDDVVVSMHLQVRGAP